MAGATGELYRGIPNRKGFIDALRDGAGMNIRDIEKAIAGGKSPADVIASIQGLPSGFAENAKLIEADARAGKFDAYAGATRASKASSSPSSMMSAGKGKASGGGKGQGAGDIPFGFAMKGAGGAGNGASLVDFGKARRVPANTGAPGDIWHEGFAGTIFQIVSGKLDSSRDRVAELEWDSPLNRALTGLPAKKPSQPGLTGLKGLKGNPGN
jgi:hypothetical protein